MSVEEFVEHPVEDDSIGTGQGPDRPRGWWALDRLRRHNAERVVLFQDLLFQVLEIGGWIDAQLLRQPLAVLRPRADGGGSPSQ